LVSKKLAGIRLIPVVLEVGGGAAADGAQAFQQLVAAGLARHSELPPVRNMDFDLVTFLKPQRFDDDGGKTNGEAVPPFTDFHAVFSADIQFFVYPVTMKVKGTSIPK
jgi:hypothetical protein